MLEHLLRGARLADARLAGQQHDLRWAADGAFQRGIQRLELALPADEWRRLI